MPFNKLDLLMAGRRNFVARTSAIERTLNQLTAGTEDLPAIPHDEEPATPRANCLLNSAFEGFDNGQTIPKSWTVAGTAQLATNQDAVSGTHTLQLTNGASAAQQAPAGVNLPQGTAIVSVFARAKTTEGQTVVFTFQHTAGVTAGDICRVDQDGNEEATNEVPADGLWYRFYQSAMLIGGASLTVTIAQGGAAGTIEIDAAKLERIDGAEGHLAATAYAGADWGATTHIRSLAADNIVTGTLGVGGSSSTNPRISVKDSSDAEIVTIGAPVGGFYGVAISGTAGLRIVGGGSAEILGGGSLQVIGGGDITVDGGDIFVLSGGVSISGSAGLTVSGGGNVTVEAGGEVIIAGTGRVRAGSSSSYHAELAAGGLALYGNDGLQNILLSSVDGKVHIFDDSLQMENGGKLSFVSGLVWADNAGLWAITSVGSAAMGVSGVNGHAWAGTTLDAGDVMIGSSTESCILWDASTGHLSVVSGGGNVVFDGDGLTILSDQNPSTYYNRLKFADPVYGNVLQLYGNVDPTNGFVQSYIDCEAPAAYDNLFDIFSYVPTTNIAKKSWITIEALTNATGANAAIAVRAGGQGTGLPSEVSISATRLTVAAAVQGTGSATFWGGLNLGTSTGAGNGDIKASGALTVTSATLGLSTFSGNSIEVGGAGTGNRNAFIDFHGQDGTDYDLRIIRQNTGANANSQLIHNGTGALQLNAANSGQVQLLVSGTKRIEANATGLGFFALAPVAQQTGGAATAGATYTSTEQGMINRMYTALRNYGLLT